MPCHVTEVAKDFIKVAFETANGIFTPPIVKIPQAMTQYMRNPTQVGDKGHAVPGNYYLGGVSGDAGGNTNFYPRGNLTTLNFNGISHVANPERMYDQLTHMGGPAGWIARSFQKQTQGNNQSQGQQQNQSVTPNNVQQARNGRTAALATQRKVLARQMGVSVQAFLTPTVTDTSNSGSNNQSNNNQQQDKDQTQFGFDKDGIGTIQSKDDKHSVVVDQKNKKIALNVPIGEWVYHGGDGKEGQYARVMTENGPSQNVKARIK
jgi:hypothetical protein